MPYDLTGRLAAEPPPVRRTPADAGDTSDRLPAPTQHEVPSASRPDTAGSVDAVLYSVGCVDGARMARTLEFHRDELAGMYRREAVDAGWVASPLRAGRGCVILPVPQNTRLDLLEGLLVDLAIAYSLDLKPPFRVVAECEVDPVCQARPRFGRRANLGFARSSSERLSGGTIMDVESRLAELLLEWDERHRQGLDVPAGELCAACPDLAPLLAARIADLKAMSWADHGPHAGEGEAPDARCGTSPPGSRVADPPAGDVNVTAYAPLEYPADHTDAPVSSAGSSGGEPGDAQSVLGLLRSWVGRRPSGDQPANEGTPNGGHGELLADIKAHVEREMASGDARYRIQLDGLNGEVEGKSWSFVRCAWVGRHHSSDLLFTGADHSASRRHAVMVPDGRDWWIADLGSTNGTWVNATRVDARQVVRLTAGDVVQFGRLTFRVATLSPDYTRLAAGGVGRSVPPGIGVRVFGLALGEVRVFPPAVYRSLAVFPLHTDGRAKADYVLGDEAVAAGNVAIAEVSDQGTVPELRVVNRGGDPALFLEGEELRGGKQNRILNASVLVPPRSEVTVPVSCVEQGRWRRDVDHSSPSQTVCPPTLRFTLKSSVGQSLHEGRGHRSDQLAVWGDVRRQHDTLGVQSVTTSMSDSFTAFGAEIADACRFLPYVEGSSGLAVAIGPDLVSVDLFDRAETCRKVWGRLMSGVRLGELVAGRAGDAPGVDAVAGWIDAARLADWRPTPTVGGGQEYRADGGGWAGSALLADVALVHFSLVARPV